MAELSDDEILKRSEEIKHRRRFDEQIKKLPKYLQGGKIVNGSGLKHDNIFYITDMDEITHEVDVVETCVYIRELQRGESTPFIIVSKPDTANVPAGYNTGIYVPDHLNIAINWGGGKKGDVKVIIDSDEFPVEVILRDSEKRMTLRDERNDHE